MSLRGATVLTGGALSRSQGKYLFAPTGANAGRYADNTMNIAANFTEPDDDIAAFRREIPDRKDVIKGELAQHGEWIVANISTDSFWPITSQKVRWRGVDIWIMPIIDDPCWASLK
jgi:hypothetical protein